MTSPATTESAVLSIHVINSGVGESIIIGLPDGKWGVVDAYTPDLSSPAANPTIAFLQNHTARALEFVCLTHPHDDHFRGIRQILESFPVRAFWRFPAFSTLDLEAQLAQSLRSGVGSAENGDEYTRMITKITALRKQHRKDATFEFDLSHCEAPKPLYPFPWAPKSGLCCRITAIAPTGNLHAQYQAFIGNCFHPNGSVKEKIPHRQHNMISMALLLEYGSTRIVLGGDVEDAGWRDVVRVNTPEVLAAHAVKVSHHGSTNGYCEGLWKAFAAHSHPYAVVTPYHRFGLPDAEAMEHIGHYAERIYSTFQGSSGGAHGITAIPGGSAVARLFLSRHARIRPINTPAAGICSLSFDATGKCVAAKCDPPAGMVKPTARA